MEREVKGVVSASPRGPLSDRNMADRLRLGHVSMEERRSEQGLPIQLKGRLAQLQWSSVAVSVSEFRCWVPDPLTHIQGAA